MNRIDTRTALGRMLSNMHLLDAPILDRHGIPYRTVEHAYQAAKTSDIESRRRLSLVVDTDPRWAGMPAKKMGRRLVLDPSFASKKLKIMEYLLRKKFEQPRFLDALLSTGSSPIVEIDPRGIDRFWAMSPQGEGMNHLGRLLQSIRDGSPVA